MQNPQDDYAKKLYELELAKQERKRALFPDAIKLILIVGGGFFVLMAVGSRMAYSAPLTIILLVCALAGVWHYWKKVR